MRAASRRSPEKRAFPPGKFAHATTIPRAATEKKNPKNNHSTLHPYQPRKKRNHPEFSPNVSLSRRPPKTPTRRPLEPIHFQFFHAPMNFTDWLSIFFPVPYKKNLSIYRNSITTDKNQMYASRKKVFFPFPIAFQGAERNARSAKERAKALPSWRTATGHLPASEGGFSRSTLRNATSSLETEISKTTEKTTKKTFSPQKNYKRN